MKGIASLISLVLMALCGCGPRFIKASSISDLIDQKYLVSTHILDGTIERQQQSLATYNFTCFQTVPISVDPANPRRAVISVPHPEIGPIGLTYETTGVGLFEEHDGKTTLKIYQYAPFFRINETLPKILNNPTSCQ